MPSETEMLEHVLVRAKDRKSHKKCKDSKCEIPPNPCNVDCCIPDCNPDCCTPAFQRLDKLRQYWQLIQLAQNNGTTVVNVPLSLYTGLPASVYNRAGNAVTVPQQNSLTPYYGNTAVAASSVLLGNNEIAAFAFVNEVRYLNYEECGKVDQVLGWTVDLQSGDLYFYQNLPDLGLTGLTATTTPSATSGTVLSTGTDRAALLNISYDNLTPIEKRQLQEMEPFWKLSLKAIERVNQNPKTEGNICEIKDKCGNRFLVAVNRAVGQNGYTTGCTYAVNTGVITIAPVSGSQGSSVCDYTSRYSIVAIKLC